MKLRLSGLVITAAGLALVTMGTARAAQPGYTYKSLFTLDQPLGDSGGTPTSGEIEVGGVSNDGTATGVVNWGDGEGAYLVTPDGKNSLVLAEQDKPNPTGGTFVAGLNNKVAINDAGNVAFSIGNDRGSGAVSEAYFVDRTDPSKPKWILVATDGTAVTGGKISGVVRFATIGNSNDVDVRRFAAPLCRSQLRHGFQFVVSRQEEEVIETVVRQQEREGHRVVALIHGEAREAIHAPDQPGLPAGNQAGEQHSRERPPRPDRTERPNRHLRGPGGRRR